MYALINFLNKQEIKYVVKQAKNPMALLQISI